MGLARSYESLAEINGIRGTFNYMSPEFFVDDKNFEIDFKADIWSFGCVLYEMITLEKAFYGNDIGQLVKKIKSGQYTIPDYITPEHREILEK